MASNKKQRMAGEALADNTPEAEEAKDAIVEAAAETDGIKLKGRGYKEGQQHYADGELVDTGRPDRKNPADDNNPYTLNEITDFDLAASGAGAKKGTERLSRQDMKRLYKQGGFSKEEIVDYANSYDFGDGPGAGGKGAQKLLARWSGLPSNDIPSDEEPVRTPQPVDPPRDGPDPYPTPRPNPMPNPDPYPRPPGIPGFGGPGFNVGGDLTQNVGKVGDTNTTIGDGNTIGDGATVGGDWSLTLGNNRAGNGYYR